MSWSEVKKINSNLDVPLNEWDDGILCREKVFTFNFPKASDSVSVIRINNNRGGVIDAITTDTHDIDIGTGNQKCYLDVKADGKLLFSIEIYTSKNSGKASIANGIVIADAKMVYRYDAVIKSHIIPIDCSDIKYSIYDGFKIGSSTSARTTKFVGLRNKIKFNKSFEIILRGSEYSFAETFKGYLYYCLN